jgi:hypothetical protein
MMENLVVEIYLFTMWQLAKAGGKAQGVQTVLTTCPTEASSTSTVIL